jgi:cytochrome d ubiquinol oxidase subunit II
MNIDLNTIWFGLVGVLLTGYAILDGFDLGVGALHLWSKGDDQRRTLINAIGPVWDGNEVCLVAGGGALFAAFPVVYATAFSGFYLAMMLVVFSLIARAVAIEFRSKRPMPWWRELWDKSFSLGSILTALLLGVAVGNIVRGVPLDGGREFAGSFWTLLHPYPLLIGISTVAMFMMHGSLYLLMKTDGALRAQVRRWAGRTFIFFVVCYVVMTLATIVSAPHMLENLKQYPILFVLPVVNILAIANIRLEMRRQRYFRAFLSSALSTAVLMALFGLGLYPNLILSTSDAANTLTIYNAASSDKALRIMLIIAAIGLPLVILYMTIIYRVFRGKVRLDPESY